jgi:diguanylate cyclase (GGDEF)-like protein/PAS domain S-box-containing protein
VVAVVMSRTPLRRRIAGGVTVAVTLSIIGVELLLLGWVYERAAPVRAERVAAAYGCGALAAEPASNEVPITSVAAQLRAQGVSRRRTDTVVADLALLPGATDGTVSERQATTAVVTLQQGLRNEQKKYDDQAFGIYILLLVGASLGWAVWFRRLVARHRSLQAEMTEQQAHSVGEHRLAVLLRNAADLTLVVDETLTVVSATPAALSLLGRTPEDVVGSSLPTLIHAGDLELLETAFEALTAGEDDTIVVRMPHSDGRVLRTETTLSDLRDDPVVGGIVLTVRDVTARWALEQQLSHDALHDALTGLGNRRIFHDRLTHALARPGSDGEGNEVVVFLDLDQFKDINDGLGHAAGDEVLAAVARRLQRACRLQDTVARLGGDEFAILLEATSTLEAELFARRLVASIAEPILVAGKELVVQASAGVASSSAHDGGGADEVMRNADVAMYQAKRMGPGNVAHYEASLYAEEVARLALRTELEAGIGRDELVLFYQPITMLGDGRMVGVEALVRWQHPERGLLPPVSFIPLAEESGLITALGSWVLRRAVEQATRLPEELGPVYVSVNVAARQLSTPGFAQEVRGVLEASCLEPWRLVLEVTESSLVENFEQARLALTELQALGIRIAVDDFGTGYSSLSYLANLPIDILKIDKSFVDHVVYQEREAQLAAAIIAMGATLDMTTTAEGIESAEQAAWLRSTGCDCGQGYLWSQPVPFDELIAQAQEKFMARRQRLEVG